MPPHLEFRFPYRPQDKGAKFERISGSAKDLDGFDGKVIKIFTDLNKKAMILAVKAAIYLKNERRRKR